MNLGDNFVQEVLLTYHSFTTNRDGQVLPGCKNFDTERSYKDMMTRFKYGNLSQKVFYIDETTMRIKNKK